MVRIIYYVFSILSIFFFIASVQFKEKKNILLMQSFASLTYIVVYAIVGALSGCLTEFVEQTKDLVFYYYENKKKKIPLILLIIFVALLFLIGVFSYQGLNSLIPLLITAAYFISSYFKNPFHIRIVMLVCGFIWIYYNISVHAYIIIIGNVLEIFSATISLIRFRKKK